MVSVLIFSRQHRDLLIESIRTHVLPALLQQGFTTIQRTRRSPTDEKSADIFPFEQLRRSKPDGATDLVEIQLMTYQRPAFRINVLAVPKEGLATFGGARSAEQLNAGGLHDHFEMYDHPKWWIWFSLRFWRFRSAAQADYDKLGVRVASFLPEVELALREGRLGPHMRRIIISRRVPAQ